MILRFQIPINIYISGSSKDSFSIKANFSQNGLICEFSVIGSEIINLPEDKERFYQKAEFIVITATEKPLKNLFDPIITNQDFDELIKIIRKLTNRCIRAIRNYGRVMHLREMIKKKNEDSKRLLTRWKVELSEDGDKWSPVVPSNNIDNIEQWFWGINPDEGQYFSELRSEYWARICEAIQDNYEPKPDDEFTLNSLEYFHLKNYRLSVVEAIIGLEIALSRYIKNYMMIYKNIDEKRVKEFLCPEFTLSARLSGLLDLTLDNNFMKFIDIQKVKKAVSWRNRIVHEDGKLPEIPEEHLSECILQVNILTSILGQKAEEISLYPKIKEIVDFFQGKYQIYPQIQFFNNHKVSVRFSSMLFKVPENFNEMFQNIVNDLITELIKRDSRFEPIQHLDVKYFYGFFPNKLKAEWSNGEYKYFE